MWRLAQIKTRSAPVVSAYLTLSVWSIWIKRNDGQLARASALQENFRLADIRRGPAGITWCQMPSGARYENTERHSR
jgi:hypothetical protein